MTRGRSAGLLPALLLSCLPACKAPDLLYEPKPDDPLDGYQGTLAEAGVSTEMDWGPKQEYLLDGFKTLRAEHAKLQRRHDELLASNQGLEAKVGQGEESLARERTLRAQAEAETEALRRKRRELEAQILGFGLEKARLEQTVLQTKIAELQRALDALASTTEAAAPPAGSR